MSAISLYEFKEILDTQPRASLLILDVRSEDEFNFKKIDNAYNIPLPELPARLEELRGYETIVLYCNEGRRAERAFHLLESLSPADELYYVAGSQKDWESHDLPVVMMA
ncbi:MAG: rhodanese-like domain-containing protein [Verrucomicrobia bacterium]|jgi:rhodanese-related sulfurtransferase|nr:rhodanese-like domain-containing protein [Verrucomicrobiota bacterium]